MNKLLLGLIPLVAVAHHADAQNRQITGRVTDRSTGEGLPGATVLLKGTTNGVSTNADGTFTLSVPGEGGTLQISSVGYLQLERAIGTETQINIGLAADTKQLSEVVVTGYGGSQDVKDITGSVAQVKEEKLLLQPVQSFDQALQGRAAGVQINSTGGTLADQGAIRIRGTNTISGSAQPLVVIDGVPTNTIQNGNVFNSGNGTRYNPLADINPNDIQSIDILKDAAASAIWGSRAANGVIIITTKRGKSGQNKVSVNSYVGFQEAVRVPEMLNGDEFIAINNEKAANARAGGNSGGIGNTSVPAVIAANSDVDGDGQPDRTDWLDKIFRRGSMQNYQVALSGGNEAASYYGSADWSDQKGILIANRLKRGSARLNLDLTPKKWLKAGLSSSYSRTVNNGVLTDGYLAGATVSGFNAPPNVAIYNASGNYNLNTLGNLGNGGNQVGFVLNNYNHPIAVAELQRNQNIAQRIIANGYLTVEPVSGLKLTSRYGIDFFNNFEDQYSSPVISGLGRALGEGLVQLNDLRRNQWNWQNYANYDKTFGENHTVSLTVGIESQEWQEKQIYTVAADFADPKYKDILDGLFTSELSGGGTQFGQGFASTFGRASYTFSNKYYANFSLRRDGSSIFGSNNQYGVFPAGSIGWRISEEGFMQGINSAARISDLKLRASYGLVGNSAGIGSYASRTLIGGGQYADANGFSITQVGNSGLEWESSKKLDIGLDASFFDDRIGLVVDYFNTDISGLLLAAPTLRTTGIPNSSINRNVGSMTNNGLEVSLNTVNVRMDNGFQWTSNINASWIKNEVTSLATPNDIISGTQRASVGKPLGVYFLPQWAGVNPANGNAQFYDKDGNIKQYDAAYTTLATATQGRWLNANGEPTTAIGAADFKYQDKGGYPTWFGGFDNTFSFKGIELGVFLQYSGGNMILNQTRQGLMTTFLNNNLAEIKERWTTPGQQTNVQKLVLRDNQSTQSSTRWLEKGDFLRMRQISLGYNLPQSVLTRVNLSNVRIYGLVQNAFVITGYTGTDPEVNSNRNNTNIGYGVDNRSVPQPRSFTFGVNIGI
ncbi:SusC/RagA family TonB-linked outer membrane protein [Hymenobacter sp. B81]|uniref:SusC/RagA family TonB-linked outer membrane protein n=1 Tax=Hymenobacter sp. B81 TaxID=3344878 RepID=UPI0037DC8DE4